LFRCYVITLWGHLVATICTINGTFQNTKKSISGHVKIWLLYTCLFVPIRVTWNFILLSVYKFILTPRSLSYLLRRRTNVRNAQLSATRFIIRCPIYLYPPLESRNVNFLKSLVCKSIRFRLILCNLNFYYINYYFFL
jgi:hypothetical protein